MNLPDCRVHNFILYAHIAPNGKVYFGITSKRLQKRWSNKIDEVINSVESAME